MIFENLYTKKRVAYELLISAINLYEKNNSSYNVIIYNSVYTAWNLIFEIKNSYEKHTNIKLNFLLSKEKVYEIGRAHV